MNKQLFEFIPILLFFIAYKWYDIYVATAVVIVATLIQVAWTWYKERKVEMMQWVTLALIVVFGGATLYLHDEQFIKWKLTIIEWLFATVFLGSQWLGKQPFIQRMMGSSLQLPPLIWKRLNLLWAGFFTAIGFLNLYVINHFTTDDWVTFKTIGVPGLMILFVVIQMIFLYKYIPETEE
ncbi:MAG: hypothetical protein RL637_1142 [Pseudomonadota bacterium]|jgi:intracellular septation protein